MSKIWQSVCGYCGVGCGLEFEENKLIGDVVYPTNEGKLVQKGYLNYQVFKHLQDY